MRVITIEFQKYPENKPEEGKTYHILHKGEIDKKAFKGGTWVDRQGAPLTGVTHFSSVLDSVDF